MTRITRIFCPNLSKFDFHLRYNVVWTNCNVLFDFFGKSNFLNFSLIDSKWWKCKLFISFFCEGVGISRFFFELSFCSASIEEDMWHGCQHTGSHNKKGVVSNLVVYNATISSGWYRWWNVWFTLSSHCLDLDPGNALGIWICGCRCILESSGS